MNTQPRNSNPGDDNRKPAPRLSYRAAVAANLVSTPTTSTPVFSQGDPAAVAAAHLPAGRIKKSNVNVSQMTRRELKKAPAMNLSNTRLMSKPSQPTRQPTPAVDEEGYTLVTATKRKAIANNPSKRHGNNGRAGRAAVPLPSFSATMSPDVQHVTERSSVRTTTTKTVTVKEDKKNS